MFDDEISDGTNTILKIGCSAWEYEPIFEKYVIPKFLQYDPILHTEITANIKKV